MKSMKICACYILLLGLGCHTTLKAQDQLWVKANGAVLFNGFWGVGVELGMDYFLSKKVAITSQAGLNSSGYRHYNYNSVMNQHSRFVKVGVGYNFKYLSLKVKYNRYWAGQAVKFTHDNGVSRPLVTHHNYMGNLNGLELELGRPVQAKRFKFEPAVGLRYTELLSGVFGRQFRPLPPYKLDLAIAPYLSLWFSYCLFD